MADPTVFSIPRRRLSVGDYGTSDATLVLLRDVGVIDSAEITSNIEANEYLATDVSGDTCREYVADANNQASTLTITIGLMSNVAANLGLMFQSDVTTTATGAATTETMPTMAVNDVVQTNFIPDASTIVIKDSDGTPATLTLDTDYEFVAKNGSMIRILSLGSYTQPFTIDYTREDQKSVQPMSSLNDYFRLAFSGGNERNSCNGEHEVFYRCRISEGQTKALHQAATQKVAAPVSVTLTADRDPARSYEFGKWAVIEA